MLDQATRGAELHVHLVVKGGLERLIVVADARPVKNFLRDG